MSRHTLESFLRKTAPAERHEGVFELEGDRFLEVHLDGAVWTKKGSMVAYTGDITFTREGVLEHGLGRAFKKMFTAEGMHLTRAAGRGVLYLADTGKKVTVLQLQGESLCFNGNDVLAFEPTLKWDIKMLRSVAGMLSGGLFNIRLEGTGLVAFTSHYDPLTIALKGGRPIHTDPHATIAWSGDLVPEIKADMQLKTFFGRGSGESLQMRFHGDGFVVVQPYEERHPANRGG
jgi:uncharacterized protein (AIM24 family)